MSEKKKRELPTSKGVVLKIAVISSQIFQIGPGGLKGYGGLEQVAWLIAKGLAERGHQVSLMAPDGSELPGGEVVPIGPPGQWDEHRGFQAYWQRLVQYDAIIDHSWAKWAYTLKQERNQDGSPVLKAPVLGVMHAPVHTMYQSLPEGVDKPCFVAISKDQAAHFEALFSRPARVAYNGIDTNFYKPMNVKRSNRFLFLARFSKIKGALLAIEACKKTGVGLDLIGDTTITNEPEYFEQCKSLCDGEQIRMVGGKSRGECVWWFSRAHCLLHPTRDYREPFGLSPVEAMLCGCPVIAWNYGAMRETIDNHKVGWLVTSEEDLRGCIHAAMQTQGSGPLVPITAETRNRCREWAMQFSAENMTKRYEELCKEAIETGGW